MTLLLRVVREMNAVYEEFKVPFTVLNTLRHSIGLGAGTDVPVLFTCVRRTDFFPTTTLGPVLNSVGR